VTDSAIGLGLGLVLGVVTGMPLGVINVSIVDAATAGRTRFAIGLGIGGGLADTVHSGLAFAGVGRLITGRTDWMRAASVIAAALIVGYAILAWRGRGPARTIGTRLVAGIPTGFALTLPNPAALAAWVATAAAIWPTIPIEAAIAIAIGVGIGSAVWFTLLARWIASIRSDHPARRYIPKLAIIALLAIAGVGIVRLWL